MTEAAKIAAGLTPPQAAACLAGEPWYPRCRGCADEDGTCPYWYFWPCDRDEREPYEIAVRAALQERGK